MSGQHLEAPGTRTFSNEMASANAELQRLNRALRTLSACNQALVRSDDEVTLLKEVCRVVVDVGGYRLAWVGYKESDANKSVRPVAQCGFEEGYLETLRITWADTERGHGPTGTAIRTGQVVSSRHILTDPNFEPWRADALKRGYASSLVLPLKSNVSVFGSLNIYSSIADAFDTEEIALLTELANDLAYGIINQRTRKERQSLEEQLRLSQKMEAVGRLASGVAHDFNNLLLVILNVTGFALDSVRESEPLWEDLQQVKEAGEKATALTRQLLAFGRKQVLDPQVVDLNAIATGLSKMLRRLVGEGIEFRQRYAKDLGLVKADPGQLEQVIMNLVVNARDAMPEGGTLTIETANVTLDEDYSARHVAVAPGNYVLLAVSDTGSGMDADTQSRIFEPFFTTKELGRGTGLGLSTAYGIVKQSGGNIWVYSEKGHGSSFKVYLPRLGDVSTAASQQAELELREYGTETILLVEDEESVRNVTARMLRASNCEVLVAANADQAIALCEKHASAIRLLLTDVVMPRVNGAKLAERLRATCPQMKVLFMSGYADQAILNSQVLDPAMRFIGKPFNELELTRKIRSILDAPDDFGGNSAAAS